MPAEFFLTDKRVIEIQECQYSDSEILNITLSKRLTVPKELDVRVFITASFFPTLVSAFDEQKTRV
ncbi:hypothetical protein NE578_10465, partial [Schaalia odontolytica]|uniref:hypothetical protein n=1 Tax=Schaalia odontolytica TaxID=1660 RepID=UPI00210C5E5B